MSDDQIKSQRIESLDALRGAAVLGIFIINIIGLGISDVAVLNPFAYGDNGAFDKALWLATNLFAEGSMRGLFSLMFGASVILYCTRKTDAAAKPGVQSLYYRRNILLIIFGLIHSSLLLNPLDILFVYGIVGLLLYPMRNLSPAILCVFAAFIMILTVIAWADDLDSDIAIATQAQVIEEKIDSGEAPSEQEQEILSIWQETIEANFPTAETRSAEIAKRTGDVSKLYVSNDRNSDPGAFLYFLWWFLDALYMMLIGMAFYRWGILTGTRSVGFYTKLALAGYSVGFAIKGFVIHTMWSNEFMPGTSVAESISPVARLFITMGHVGVFFLFWHFCSTTFLMRALTATGRMALSNYIGQTVVMTLLFTSLGFGLYGQFDRSELYGIMLIVWTFQLVLSVAWLKRYKMGPVEWVWRVLTYIKMMPNRR